MTAFDGWLAALGSYRRDINHGRETPFIHTLTFAARDLTGAAFVGEIKASPGQASAALAAMSFGSITYSTNSSVTATITQANINGLPEMTDKSEPIELVYDIYVTPSGGERELVMGGIFKVNAGVTQA